MKNLIKSFAVIAAILSFVACQKEIDGPKDEPKVTHKVTFVAGNPETKTTATIDKEHGVVDYAWTEADENRFVVYEINGDTYTPASETTGVLDGDGTMYIMAEFEGSAPAGVSYQAILNTGVKANQETASESYDEASDVLMSEIVKAADVDVDQLALRFKRMVAFGEATLKNLNAGEYVSKIVVESLDETILAAEFNLTTKEFSASGSKSITFEADDNLLLDIDQVNHTAKFRFATIPVESALLKVSVTTIDAEEKVVGKYVKEFAKAISFERGNLKKFNIALENDYLDPHINDEGWFRVEDARALNAGDEIRIGSYVESSKKYLMAGAFDTDRFSSVDVQYNADYSELERISLDAQPITLTLGGTTDSWTLTNGEDNFSQSGADIKKNADGAKLWKISITDNVAKIQGDGETKWIMYNASSPRFKCYDGQTSVYIYKKYGNPTDKGLRAECDVEFRIDGAKVEVAEATMGSDQNVFPEVYTTSTGAKTFSSDNRAVATVDENGVVTLVSDGTAKIKVEIAETEDMKEGSAEYTLTVNPEPDEYVDLLNRDWTGIESGSSTYAAWENKTGSFSGNTYAGNSAGDKNSIQLRSNNNNSGIVITVITSKGYLARSVEVSWNGSNTNGRTLNVYGKNTAYTSASDLYAEATSGEKLGTIVYGTSTTLEITGDYKYLGFRSNSGAMYLDNIQITWEEPKPAREGLGFYLGETKVTEPLSATVGDAFTAPILKDNNGVIEGATYTSSATDVADFVDGVLTLKKKGTTTITASVPATAEYAAGEATYTLNVGNKLASIAMADGTAQQTIYYVGDEFSFAGIKVTATYNDGTTKTLTDEDLTAENFSGFNSEAPVAEQAITVTYTENDIPADCQYNVEIRERVTLYDITLPAAVNGNTVTVEGGATQAPAGETVTLVVTPATANGYYLTSLKVNGGDELYTESIKLGGEVEITMPAEAITVTANFSNLYTVTLTQPAENGAVKVAGTTTASQTFAYGATVNVVAEPADGYELDEWTVTGATLADASALETSFTMPKNAVSVTASFKVHVASVHDVLTNADLAATGTTYTNFTNVSKNTAVYAGQSSKNNGIQLRATSPSGIVTTTSGGKIKTVTVKWNSNCAAGRILDVYGKNSAYSTAADLYNSTDQGTKIGSITQGTSTSLTISTDYAYVGVRSNNGALNIDEIDFEWGDGDTPTPPTPTKLSAPGSLNATNIQQTSATLSWAAVANASGYKVKIGSTEYDAPSTSYSATNLTAGTQYTWTVKAIGDNVNYTESDYAANAQFTTQSGGSPEKDFNTTYSYGLSDWSLTNYTDQSSYYQVPSGNNPSVATIAGIFKDKTITSDVVITINCATYGSGTNPSASTFSVYKETACTNQITASQGGTLPTSSTYQNVTYTITKANAASFANDLAIKITKPGKTIRLKSIKVVFKYTE